MADAIGPTLAAASPCPDDARAVRVPTRCPGHARRPHQRSRHTTRRPLARPRVWLLPRGSSALARARRQSRRSSARRSAPAPVGSPFASGSRYAGRALDVDASLLDALEDRADGLPIQTVVADARELAIDRRFPLILVPMQTLQLFGARRGARRSCAARWNTWSPVGSWPLLWPTRWTASTGRMTCPRPPTSTRSTACAAPAI
jgi:hypothetical protein